MATFASVLDRPSSEIERPKPLPVGTYLCITKGLPSRGKSEKTGTEFVEFKFVPMQPLEDVDQDDLETYLTRLDGSKDVLNNTNFTHRFWTSEKSAYRLKDFLTDDLDVPEKQDEDQEEEDSLWERSQHTAGLQCLVVIRHTATQDGKAIQQEVALTKPAE